MHFFAQYNVTWKDIKSQLSHGHHHNLTANKPIFFLFLELSMIKDKIIYSVFSSTFSSTRCMSHKKLHRVAFMGFSFHLTWKGCDIYILFICIWTHLKHVKLHPSLEMRRSYIRLFLERHAHHASCIRHETEHAVLLIMRVPSIIFGYLRCKT